MSLFRTTRADYVHQNSRISCFAKHGLRPLIKARPITSSEGTRASYSLNSVRLKPRRCVSHRYERSLHTQLLSSYEPTIYALSTAPGKAAIAVIRISGPAALQVRSAIEDMPLAPMWGC